MSKFGTWRIVEEEKRMPLWVTHQLSKEDFITLINNMLEIGKIPARKTEIMNEAYARLAVKDFEVFKKCNGTHGSLAEKLFEKFFPDYEGEK
jgi:hypothetical protein